MTPEEFRALAEQHRGLVGHKILSPTVKTKDRYGEEVEGPNPSPEVRYEFGDGTHVVARQDPSSAAFAIVDGGTALGKSARSSASADESVSAPTDQPFVASRRPDGTIVWTPSKNYQPETVRRPAPVPVEGGRDDWRGSATETISKAQADYELKAQAEQRAGLRDLQARAEAAETAALQKAQNAIAQDRLDKDQAWRLYQQDIDKIRLAVESEANALTRRGQDIAAQTAREGHAVTRRGQDIESATSRRGQDITAGVASRGQDLSYEQGLVGSTVQMANTIASHSAPLWQIAQVDATTRGGWGERIPAMPQSPPGPLFGTDPAAFVAAAAQSARAQRPAPYQLPPAEQYQIPPAGA